MKNTILLSIIVLVATNCINKQNEESTMETTAEKKLLSSIEKYVIERTNEFEIISEERKKTLEELSAYVKKNGDNGDSINLNFICTHNSRRSHMSQLWSQVAAFYYDVENVKCYSGGTEATAFNERSVKALKKAGFQINKLDETDNPMYDVTYADGVDPIQAFSKKYGHEVNPKENFAAIMTCSHADEACPVVFGASERITITFDDPKIADNTPEEEAKYDERSQQIAREMLYAFSKIN